MEFEVSSPAENCVRRLESHKHPAIFIFPGIDLDYIRRQDGTYEFMIARTWRTQYARYAFIQARVWLRPLNKISTRVSAQLEFTGWTYGIPAMLGIVAIICFVLRQPAIGLIAIAALLFVLVIIWFDYSTLRDMINDLGA